MGCEYYFFELSRGSHDPGRRFSLRRSGMPMDVLYIYLTFDSGSESWRLTRHPDGRLAQKLHIMEIEGGEDNPPIDLALATLALMGY